MLKNKSAPLLLLLLLISESVIGQVEFSTGLLLDENRYAESEKTPVLMRGDFANLPLSKSLEIYTPPAADQGGLSTCAGWAVSYYGRTILEAIKYQYSGKYLDLNTFSPSFIYNQIRPDTGCYWGVSLTDALDVLKNHGSLKISSFAYDCQKTIGTSELREAKKYRIKDYREIFSRNDADKVQKAKKSLAENKPVIIAIDCPPSFNSAGEFWLPVKNDYSTHNRGHALAVIGYADDLNEGCFKVINSWGPNWGVNGTTWMSYADFQFFAYYGFELIDYPLTDNYSLAGDLKFVTEKGDVMKTVFNGRFFEFEKPFSAGTKFQVYLKNKNSAYVYVFSTDLKNNTFKIFPPGERTSALLPYSESNIALPDEFHYNMLDDVKGKSYYIFLYSKNEIDLNKLISESKKKKSDIYDFLKGYFGSSDEKVQISGGSSISYRTDKSAKLICILIEFKHI